MLVSGSIGSYFYTAAINNLTDSLRTRLKYSAAILSHSFIPNELDRIRNAPENETALYDKYITKLRALVGSNPDIAFIYVMSLSDNQVIFVLDSDTEEPADIGEAYEEYIPELIQGFKANTVDKDITTDKWGSFMSGYAPIEGGATPYLVGIDMYADEVHQKLATLKERGLVSLLLSILFAYTCAHFLSKSMLLRIKTLHDRCLDHAPVRDKVIREVGDELDRLGNAFDYMIESVEATHNDLERRVKSRTEALENTNTRLTEEIDERRRMESILKESAYTDYLTGLLNRSELTNKLKNATSLNRPYSVILIDIDDFKAVNDQYGHDAGDDILRKFARALLHLVNKNDTSARWGGEEFIVFMPDTPLEKATLEAERIRTELENSPFDNAEKPIAITVSIGVAEHLRSNKWEQTIKLADIALYNAKTQGRNRVINQDQS